MRRIGAAFSTMVIIVAFWCVISGFVIQQNRLSFSPDVPSQSMIQYSEYTIPEFSGQDVIVLNYNVPCFTQYDYTHTSGEQYSELDELGRCGPAVVMLHNSMMPTEERGEIGHIRPSGWNQAKYEGIINYDPPYLYNRCHLVAFSLTGQNDNELNLITGTRHFNTDGMFPYEKKIAKYLSHTDNHVLYRVTPYFKDDELVARGVEIEAYSIEDHGMGISFHVFVYNYQPGIHIDYSTGENGIGESDGL